VIGPHVLVHGQVVGALFGVLEKGRTDVGVHVLGRRD
jgi:hypothetical protein